jgi:ketosteroid isomerase-like protein
VIGVSASETEARNLEKARQLVRIYETEGPWAVDERFDEFFHPDYEWRAAVAELGDRTYVGREGYREWQKEMEEITEEAIQSDFEVRAMGDRVVLALSRMRIVGKESGAAYESEYGAVYEMEDGRGVAGRAFLSHSEAIEFAEKLAGGASDA